MSILRTSSNKSMVMYKNLLKVSSTKKRGCNFTCRLIKSGPPRLKYKAETHMGHTRRTCVIFFHVSGAEWVPNDFNMYYRNAVTVFSLFREGLTLCLNTEGLNKKQMPNLSTNNAWNKDGCNVRDKQTCLRKKNLIEIKYEYEN